MHLWPRKSTFTFFGKLMPVLLIFSCAAQIPRQQKPRITDAVRQLQTRIETLLQDSTLAQTRTGIKVVSLNTGEVLYEKNSNELFNPASNMKLLTTATALKVLGPAFRFKTILYTDVGAVADSVIQGNLYLKGFGDPELTADDLRAMIRELKFSGIRKINGNLICDASYFDDLYWGSGWMWDDTSSPDFAPISALTVNDNVVKVIVSPGKHIGDSLTVIVNPPTNYVKIENKGLTVSLADSDLIEKFKVERKWKIPENTIVIEGGMPVNSPTKRFSIEVLKPALYAGTLFREILQEEGITFEGSLTTGVLPDTTLILTQHFSDPLSLIVFNTNKISDNLSAEQMLKTLGAAIKGPPGSARKGITIINQYLSSIGVDTTRFEIADGSGVSRYNVITPAIIIEVLKDMHRDFQVQGEYQASLPIAGVDGTLKNRMRQSPAQSILRAKTGTLRGVSALSGYTRDLDGEILAFSIMMEHFVGSASRVRAIQDSIGIVLTTFTRNPKTLKQESKISE